jgi:hypothetical protein
MIVQALSLPMSPKRLVRFVVKRFVLELTGGVIKLPSKFKLFR